MNRRDFAKGLAALPLLKAVGFAQICTSGPCQTNPNALMIVLQGPFALVINSASPWNITAFTPKHNGEHLFAFNGSVCDNDAKYAFLLENDGLMPATAAPCVDSPLPRFCAENTPVDRSPKDHFVSIHLPAPQRIFIKQSGNLMATMEDPGPGTKFALPGDRILEYDNPDMTKVRMLGSGDGDLTQLPPVTGKRLFTFEVGLPNLLGGGDSDPDGSHAIDFYNNSLLPHFSALAHDTKRRIQDITPHAVRRGVSTFECKIGGPTVTSP